MYVLPDFFFCEHFDTPGLMSTTQNIISISYSFIKQYAASSLSFGDVMIVCVHSSGVRLTDIDVDEDRRRAAQAFRVVISHLKSCFTLHLTVMGLTNDLKHHRGTGMDSARDGVQTFPGESGARKNRK